MKELCEENLWELGSRKRGHPTTAVIAKCHHCQEHREVWGRAVRHPESLTSTTSFSSSPLTVPPIGQTQSKLEGGGGWPWLSSIEVDFQDKRQVGRGWRVEKILLVENTLEQDP